MEKPIQLVIEETKVAISNAVNNSKLPIYIVEAILKDLYSEARQLSAQTYQKELIKYNEYLKQQKKDTATTENAAVDNTEE